MEQQSLVLFWPNSITVVDELTFWPFDVVFLSAIINQLSLINTTLEFKPLHSREPFRVHVNG